MGKKCSHNLLYADVISLFETRKCWKIKKMMRIVNIDKENKIIRRHNRYI